MSWNEFSMDEIEFQLIIENGELFVIWTCLRCKHRQKVKIDVIELSSGTPYIECENTEVCGKGLSHFVLQPIIEMAIYKDQGNIPLENIPDPWNPEPTGIGFDK